MTTAQVQISGVVLRPLDLHTDDRGYFSEILRDADYPVQFVQSNHSFSNAGVLRGLHYHRNQADLWYVVSGSARVGLVDLRNRAQNPPSIALTLAADRPQVLFIPPGIGHGFHAESDVHLIYWVSVPYDGSDEFGIAWNDPTLAIDWGTTQPKLSERDANNPPLQWDQIPSFS